jgi:hypothetical protein
MHLKYWIVEVGQRPGPIWSCRFESPRKKPLSDQLSGFRFEWTASRDLTDAFSIARLREAGSLFPRSFRSIQKELGHQTRADRTGGLCHGGTLSLENPTSPMSAKEPR